MKQLHNAVCSVNRIIDRSTPLTPTPFRALSLYREDWWRTRMDPVLHDGVMLLPSILVSVATSISPLPSTSRTRRDRVSFERATCPDVACMLLKPFWSLIAYRLSDDNSKRIAQFLAKSLKELSVLLDTVHCHRSLSLHRWLGFMSIRFSSSTMRASGPHFSKTRLILVLHNQ